MLQNERIEKYKIALEMIFEREKEVSELRDYLSQLAKFMSQDEINEANIRLRKEIKF